MMPSHTASVPSSLDQDYGLPALCQSVDGLWPGFRAQALPSIDSTNSELMRRARAGDTAPTLLVAQSQTAGKGRMGKSWQSDARTSLAFSLGLTLSPLEWSGLSLVVGMVLAERLHALRQAQSSPSPQRLGLKWPNDVWTLDAQGQGRKLAGILVETTTLPQPGQHAPNARHVVIGIGLNLAEPPPSLADGFATPAAHLQGLLGQEVAAAEVLRQIVPALLAALRDFAEYGFVPWQEGYAQWDLLARRNVTLSDGRSGLALGVDAQGELLLQTAAGTEAITSGEVSVRPG